MSIFWYLLRGVCAALGGILGRLLGVRSEGDSRRRDLRVQVLVDAWRKVERAAMRVDAAELRGLEEALADVQLFGTPSQVEQAANVARSMNEGTRGTAGLDGFLQALRDDLRAELRLARIETPLVSLRRGKPISLAGRGKLVAC
jgi:hypothetical protein